MTRPAAGSRWGLPDAPPVPVQVAAVASAFAGLVHVAVVPEHRADWLLAALFLTALGAFQLVWAAWLWTGPDRAALLSGVLVNTAVLALWTVSRTGGLPFGPHAGQAEGVGAVDLSCSLAEVAVVVVLASLQAAGQRGRQPWSSTADRDEAVAA